MDRTRSVKSSVKPSSKKAGSSRTSKPKASAVASRKASTTKSVSTKSTTSKPVAKTGKVSAAGLEAKVNTPAKLARRAELCGSRPGGADAYYFSERCLLKTQLDKAMTKNRRAAAFIGKTMQEMPILEKLSKEAKPTPADLQVAFNDPMAVEALVRIMSSPAYMDSHPNPVDRYAAAVSKLSRTHPNIVKKPEAFKKMVMRQTYNVFYASAQNVQEFKGRPTTRRKST